MILVGERWFITLAGVSLERPGRSNKDKFILSIKELDSQLIGAYIECLPYQEFISRYDRPNTLFYLDPPYWNNENDNGKGKFILSLNDVPQIRAIFKDFYIKEIKTKYTVGTQHKNSVGELLISNVDLNSI